MFLEAVFGELERRPAHISGTSIGAVIGALYAAGLSAEEIEELAIPLPVIATDF